MGAAVAAVLVAVVAPSAYAQPAGRAELVRFSLLGLPAEAGGHNYGGTGSISLLKSWSPRKRRGAITMRDTAGTGCIYDIRLTAQAVPWHAQSAVEQLVAHQGPVSYVIDSGTRGSGAWRVAYRSGGTKRARALIGDALFPYTGVWRGVHIVAEFGTNCHYGTYRYAIGPQIADALAGYRGRT